MRDVSEVAVKPVRESEMTRRFGPWMAARSEAFVPASARYFKRQSAKK